MAVRAKFYVANVTLYPPKKASADDAKELGIDEGTEFSTGSVKMQPVTRGEINKPWSRWTPSGAIQLDINNPHAFQQFVDLNGKEFYVDFTPAPPDEQG
jgi:hypothetical protein